MFHQQRVLQVAIVMLAIAVNFCKCLVDTNYIVSSKAQ